MSKEVYVKQNGHWKLYQFGCLHCYHCHSFQFVWSTIYFDCSPCDNILLSNSWNFSLYRIHIALLFFCSRHFRIYVSVISSLFLRRTKTVFRLTYLRSINIHRYKLKCTSMCLTLSNYFPCPKMMTSQSLVVDRNWNE